MNVEFVANHIQIWKKEDDDESSDYYLCFTQNGIYVTIGVDIELMEHLRQWLNNIHSSVTSPKKVKDE